MQTRPTEIKCTFSVCDGICNLGRIHVRINLDNDTYDDFFRKARQEIMRLNIRHENGETIYFNHLDCQTHRVREDRNTLVSKMKYYFNKDRNNGTLQVYRFQNTISENPASQSVEINESVVSESKSSKPIEVQDKTNFLAKLQTDLNTMSQASILDLFAELKQRDGKYAFIHEQKNPIFDHFRLFFKSKRNNEETFWHTASYQAAVKMLKEAYITKNDHSAANRTREATNFIDYVRGNSVIPIGKTSTRKSQP